MALFEAGELRAQHGVLFSDALRFGLERFQLFAKGLKGLFAVGALVVLLFNENLVLGSLFVGALLFASKALEFEAGDGNAGVGAVDFLGSAAEVVVERDGFFFGGLLALAKALEVSFECPGFFLKGILALDGDGKRLVRSFLFRRVVTQFSLKDQRATGFCAASGKEAAGVALAVRQEEVFVGVGFG